MKDNDDFVGEVYFCARLKWPGDDSTWVQVMGDGSIHFEDDVTFSGRIEQPDILKFFHRMPAFAQAYAEAVNRLEELNSYPTK